MENIHDMIKLETMLTRMEQYKTRKGYLFGCEKELMEKDMDNLSAMTYYAALEVLP